MFEETIEKIMREVDENATGEDLVRCLGSSGDEGGFAVELLLGVTEFANFVDLMKHFRREMNEQ